MTVLLDAHVHFHPCFRSDSFLDAAWRNLVRAAEHLQKQGKPEGVLLLADPPGCDSLAALRRQSGGAAARWRVAELDEEISLRAEGPDGESLTVVQGYQTPTAERLEVLALCCRGTFEAGASMAELTEESLRAGALTVAPWGFGKWLGSRGRLMASYIDRVNSRMFFVGDSGARLAGTPEPELIRQAAEVGIFNLPGSDPFPFPDHETRVARRGFVLDGTLDPARPGESLRARLAALTSQPRTFGTGMGPLHFLGSQLRMQLPRRA